MITFEANHDLLHDESARHYTAVLDIGSELVRLVEVVLVIARHALEHEVLKHQEVVRLQD
jgi:hypothetical protein